MEKKPRQKSNKYMQKYFIISELLNLAGGALGWFFVELYLPFF